MGNKKRKRGVKGGRGYRRIENKFKKGGGIREGGFLI